MQLNEGLNWETFTWWISGALDVVQMTGKCAGISLPVFTWGGFDREEESVVVNRRIPTNDNTVGGVSESAAAGHCSCNVLVVN